MNVEPDDVQFDREQLIERMTVMATLNHGRHVSEGRSNKPH